MTSLNILKENKKQPFSVCEIGVPKNFAKSAGKQLCSYLSVIELHVSSLQLHQKWGYGTGLFL